jgi:hypothetical protein
MTILGVSFDKYISDCAGGNDKIALENLLGFQERRINRYLQSELSHFQDISTFCANTQKELREIVQLFQHCTREAKLSSVLTEDDKSDIQIRIRSLFGKIQNMNQAYQKIQEMRRTAHNFSFKPIQPKDYPKKSFWKGLLYLLSWIVLFPILKSVYQKITLRTTKIAPRIESQTIRLFPQLILAQNRVHTSLL